jgi:hypothetical protein
MISTATYAYAIDIREDDNGTRRGVGLLVPSARYAALSSSASQQTVARPLSTDTWRAIDAWIAESNAHLPAKPAALGSAITADVLGVADAAGVTARRFAAIRLPFEPGCDAESFAADLLPALARD